MTDDNDIRIDSALAGWLDRYEVSGPDAVLVRRCMLDRSDRTVVKRMRLPLALAALSAFLAGAGVSYARVSDIDAGAMTDSMLSYGYTEQE